MVDFDKLVKDIAAKSTVEDSVDVLVLTVANELMAHPRDAVAMTTLGGHLVLHLKALSKAVAENLE
jgi:hypothetical protein